MKQKTPDHIAFAKNIAEGFYRDFPKFAKYCGFGIPNHEGSANGTVIFSPECPPDVTRILTKEFDTGQGPAYMTRRHIKCAKNSNFFYIVRLPHPSEIDHAITTHMANIIDMNGPQSQKPAHFALRDPAHITHMIADHEIGHLIFIGTGNFELLQQQLTLRDTHHLNECYADTYAFLRNQARFGANSDIADAWIFNRARLAANMRKEYAYTHMTASCLMMARDFSRDCDISKLSSRQIAEHALRIIAAYGTTPDWLQNLGLFERFRIAAEKKSLSDDFMRLAQAMAAQAQEGKLPPDIVRACIDGTRIFHSFKPAEYNTLAYLSASLR